LQEGQYEITVPVIADRCLQALVLGALEPEWEARFGARSYGFRPGRGCHDAIVAIHTTAKGKNAKRLWVIDADLKAAFDRIDHAGLLASLGTFPGKGMIAGWLKAGVIEKGWFTPTVEGTPQGGVLSPLMANVVLHRLDREWQQRYQRLGVIVRYADDLCICCPTEQRAQAALVVLRELLGGLGLALSGPKTQIVGVASGEMDSTFWGFTIEWWCPGDILLTAIRRVGRVPKRWTAPDPGYGTPPGAADAISRPTCW